MAGNSDLFTTAGAVKAARYHYDRATSPGLKFYWKMVLEGLGVTVA